MTSGDVSSQVFTLKPEDLYFLLDQRLPAAFGEFAVDNGSREAAWRKFIKRNVSKGLVEEDGSPTAALREAVEPIRNFEYEVGLTNRFPDIELVKITAAFYGSAAGTTFVRPVSSRRRAYEIELLANDTMREEVLRREFGFDYDQFAFSGDPFSFELDEDTTNAVLECGHGRDPYELRRMARRLGIDFTHLTTALSVFSQEDRLVILSACNTREKGLGVSLSYLITGSPSLGVMIRSLGEVDAVFKKTSSFFTRFERLAEQSFWDYFTDYPAVHR